jgi:hypothetical protein
MKTNNILTGINLLINFPLDGFFTRWIAESRGKKSKLRIGLMIA